MNKKVRYIYIIILVFLIQGKGFAQEIKNNNNFPDVPLFDTLTGYDPSKAVFTISCTATPVTCFGLCDGTITVSLASGSPNYPIDIKLFLPAELGGGTIDYFNIPALPYTITGLCGAVAAYTVRVVDQDGPPYKWCSSNVNAPGEMIVSDYVQIDETCPGACDGSVQINFIQNAVYPVSDSWSSGETVDNIVNKCAGTYTDTVTDANGCVHDFDFTIVAPPLIVIDSVVYDAVFCSGGSGCITVYASGGTPPYMYDIGLGGGFVPGNTFCGLAAGTYTITVQDATPCTGVTNPITIAENTPLTLSAVVDSVSCNAGSDGTIDITVVGGQGPYTFSWSNGEITEDISNLIAGNYCVTVADIYGCTATACYDVYEPLAITILETHVNPCFGASDGSIDITVSGGYCSNYTFLWSNGSFTEDISGLPQGSYTVTVTDCRGCSNTLTVNLVQNPQITITETHVNYPCFASGCVGSINITPGGGTPGYTFSWSGPSGYSSNSEDIVNLCFGVYTVTVTDAAGCTKTLSVTITRPTQITINLVLQTNVTCFGLCNGAIDINPTGGGLPYTSYSWTGPSGFTASTQDVVNLCAGNYSVTVTNSAGCTRVRAFTITEPPDITISLVSQTNVLCNGFCTGAIDLTVGGGTPPFTYLWNGPSGYSSTNLDITNLCAGVYDLTVTDSKPCTKTYSVTITEPPALTLSETQTEISCNGVCDGAINITVGGGTPGYTYNWTGPSGYNSISEDISPLCAGTYNVTVTDANGCTLDTSFTLAAPSLITVTDTHVDLPCNGVCNGSINLIVAGGNPCPNYTYNWTGPGGPYFIEDLSNLCAGTYDVTVTDCNGCTATHSVTIIQPAGFTVTETHVNETCFGDCTGSIDITVVGGTPPYTYSWIGPGGPYAIDDLTNLCVGNYDLTVTDAALCTATISVTITEPAEIILSEVHGNIAPCFGLSNGWITVTAIGGSGTYTYDWSPNGFTGDGTPTYSNLIAGNYTVTVTDVPNGCTKVLGPIVIIQPPDINVVSVDVNDVLCFGGNTGSFTVHALGGSPPYQFNIGSGYGTDSTFTGLSQGSYTVTVMDVPGCTTTQLIVVGEPSALTTGISSTDITCNGVCNGTATVTPANGTPGYTYEWDDPLIQTTQTATGLCVGPVSVTVTDLNGCTITASTVINSPPPFTATISDSMMSCGSYVAATAGTTFLPDGTGVSYTSTLTQTDFGSGQVINSSNDINSICLNMEHSWLGDLEIRLICPSMQSVVLHPFTPGTGATRVGEPVFVGTTGQPDQNNSDLTPGTGYNYCFMESGASYNTWSNEANTYTYSYTDNSGNAHVNDAYLPSGSYLSSDNFSSLIGCPVNGDWSIEVTDNQGLDNGYIFSWLLNFDNSILPTNFCNGSAVVTTVGGQAPYTYNWSNSSTNDTVTNLCSGNYCATVTDANTCTATACVTIIDVNLNIDSFTTTDASCNGVCNGSATVNISGGFAPISYSWSNGGNTQTINNLCAGQYYVTVTEDNGCTAVDSVTIGNLYALSANTSIVNPISCSGVCDASATVNVLNGLPPYTYLWCDGQTLQTAINLCAGTCNVTVSDANGCTTTTSVIINAPIPLTASITSQTNVTCNGLCDGTATVTPNGGTAPYSYTWCNGSTVSNANGLCAGVCVVTVTDFNGCFVTASVTITEPALLTSSISSQTNVSCNGLCDGTATVGANGGTPGYTYLWCNGQTTQTATSLCAGNCIVTVTDGNGCTSTSTVTITEPAILIASISSQTNVSCFGTCNGTATAGTAGGTPGFTYLWCNGQTTQTATNLCAGTCTVTVTDNNSCTSTASVTITEPPVLSSSFSGITQAACNGGCTGTLTVDAAGGSGTYTSYQWNPNVGSTPSISSLCAGWYFVTVTDDLGCTTTNQYEITDPSDLLVDTVSTSGPSCNGNCDGSATIIISGGTPPYTPTWPDLTNGLTNSSLCDGTYIITVTDGNLCSRQLLIDITEPAVLSFTITSTSPVCNGDCNGTATVVGTGGTPPYSAIWGTMPVQNTLTATGLCDGTYDVTVTDDHLCPVAPQQVIIASPPVLSGTLDITQNVVCNGVCSGVLTANPSGGVLPYTYAWSPNITETAQEADSLCAGTYDVTITDSNGCSVTVQQTLVAPNVVTATIIYTSQVLCFGDTSGMAVVEGGGGTQVYTYLWDMNANSQTNDTAINLGAGFYFVTVFDSNGCTASTMATVLDNSDMIIDSVVSVNPLCFGQCNGSIELFVSGGTPGYNYTWSNDPTNNTSSDDSLCVGNYFITVYDTNLCSRFTLVTLTEPPALSDSIPFTPISCSSLCDGSAIVFPYGGTGSYQPSVWDVPQNGDTAINLCAGTYNVTVTDANGCTNTDAITLIAPQPLLVSISVVDSISCNGICDGSVAAVVVGGTPPYTYAWNNLLTTDTITGLCSGTYNLTVTDSGSCSAIASITLDEPSALQISFSSITQVLCGPGNCTGSATANASGGTGVITYLWDVNAGGQTTQTAINLCANIYNVVATDEHGCTINGTVIITDTALMSVSITNINHVTCAGNCDGSATATVSGGLPPHTYQWDDPGLTTTATVSNLCQGVYHVTVIDANWCSRIDSVVITDAAAVTATELVTPLSCTGLCDASIVIIPSGGIPSSVPPPYTYVWSIVGLADSTASGLCPGTYYYTVTDGNGCSYNDTVTIVDPGSMQANLSIVDSIKCHGVCIGSITSTPSGSLGPYIYIWSNGDTTQTIINLCAGNYSVTVTGIGGCSAIDSIFLPEPDSLNITFDSIVQPLCNGDSTGTVMAVVTGGIPAYSYLWDANADNATTAMIDTLVANMYFITVTDANGCTQSSYFELHDTSHVRITVTDSMMVTCYGSCNGWYTVRADSGTPFILSPYYIYEWSNLQTGPTANNLCAGFYTVTATDSLVCKSVKLVEVTQPDSLFITLIDSTSITCATNCNGSLTVNITGGTPFVSTPFYVFEWSNDPSADTTISNLCSGLQQLNIRDSLGCTDTLRYYLSSPDTLLLTITAQNALCSNGSNDGNLLTTVTGGVPQYTYLWSNDSITQNLMNAPFGAYWITITDANGCQKIDSSEITATIVVDALARWDTTICYGDSVQIFGFGGNVFSWNPGTGLTDSTVYDPWASPVQTTTYYFTARDSICFDVDSVTVQVYPQLDINAGPDLTIFADHGTLISATSNDPLATYLWTPNTGLSDSTSLNPFAEPLVTTTYLLFATNTFGCVEVDTMVFTVISKIPNGITPNGDGDNDVWMLDIVSKYPECEVEIYNRWGEQLFYSRGYPDSERWDGTFKGKPLPTGTYYYIINLHDTEENLQPITGPITIMR